MMVRRFLFFGKNLRIKEGWQNSITIVETEGRYMVVVETEGRYNGRKGKQKKGDFEGGFSFEVSLG